MSVTLSPQLEAMIQERVDAGHYESANDVVRQALLLLDERDREAQLEHLRGLLQVGLDSARRGEPIEFNEEYLEDLDRRVEARFLRGDVPNPDVCP